MTKPDGLDLITLTGVQAHGFHGVFPSERANGQTFIVDIQLGLQLQEAAETGDLTATVHYGELAEQVNQLITGEPVELIESLALRIVNMCFEFEPVAWVSVTVHKPEAPIPVAFNDVAVTIERSRQ